jgi:hypothetical protein
LKKSKAEKPKEEIKPFPTYAPISLINEVDRELLTEHEKYRSSKSRSALICKLLGQWLKSEPLKKKFR